MPTHAKFVVFEGIDGSGKRTQLEMLSRSLAGRGIPCEQVGFPNYSGFFGNMVARFLNGEFGSLETVAPHFSALLYAGDRLESKGAIENALACGGVLLADRYIASNLAHQGARVAAKDRGEFLEWIRKLEYEVYGLPQEDLVVYLRVPVAQAHQLIGAKARRVYTEHRHDLQEASLAHLSAAAEVYDELATQSHWVKVDCLDPASGSMRTPASIHEEVASLIERHLSIPAGAGR